MKWNKMSSIKNKIIEDLKNPVNKINGIFITSNANSVQICVTISKDKFIETLRKQELKGLKKYGITIDECPVDKYNWTDMMDEEFVDGVVYAYKNEDSVVNIKTPLRNNRIDVNEEIRESKIIQYYGISK